MSIFYMQSVVLGQHVSVTTVTSPLGSFFSDSNLRLFISKDGTTALSGTHLANRYHLTRRIFLSTIIFHKNSPVSVLFPE